MPDAARRASQASEGRGCGFCLVLFGQQALGPLYEGGAGADIKRTLRAVEKVLFELIPRCGIKFIEQISFRHFLSNHYSVVHRRSFPLLTVVQYSVFPFQIPRASPNMGGSFPMFFR